MKNKFLLLIASLCLLSSAIAQDKKADDHSNMVIADVHRHVQHWITPSSLLAEMDELKIGWAGAVSAPYGPWDIQPYIQLLGKRYIATTGQMTLTDIHRFKGVRAIEDAQTQDYKALEDEANQFFGAGAIKGLGELILNNENTNPNPAARRKARIDSPLSYLTSLSAGMDLFKFMPKMMSIPLKSCPTSQLNIQLCRSSSRIASLRPIPL